MAPIRATTTEIHPLRSPSDDPGTDKDSTMHDGTKAQDDRPKRKRQSQSCDACRSRKVRCARDNPDDQTTRCKHCTSLGVPCTYEYQPKKRGPPNLYLRRLQEAAAAAAAAQREGVHAINGNTSHDALLTDGRISSISPSTMAMIPNGPHSFTRRSPSNMPSLNTAAASTILGSAPSTSFLPEPAPSHHALTPISPSRYPIAADAPYNQAPPALYSVPGPFDRHSTTDTISSGVTTSGQPPPPSATTTSNLDSNPFADSYGLYQNWNGSGPYPFKPHQPPPPSCFPTLNHYYRPHRLNDIAPREMILQIIQLFFDFLYPLTPCIHRPSFMADLSSHREERDPLFFALVMSTAAATLVQVPRSYLPLVERKEVRRLAQTCYEASRHITIAAYDPPTSTHVVIRYFDTCYHFREGHGATSHASFGEAVHIAVTLNMHEEASYEGLDPIETEMRRRVFWLLFGGDKSMSILLGRPICLRDEDCTLHFPKEVDDEYITANGILPQPHGKTAIVSGLNYMTRMFSLLGEILVRIRVDKRSPPQGHFAEARLEEIHSLHIRILNSLAHCSAPLRLKTLGAGVSSVVGVGPTGGVGGVSNCEWPRGAGFRQATFAEVRELFDNPKASRTNASNPFLVMQANLYVTQQLVRFVIEQYRDELMLSIGATTAEELEISSQEDREAIASDLLNVLYSIPIQSIATNGPSIVHKVRFVASTLLDAVRKAETAPAPAARAHAYLLDFLSILSEIERNYLLGDDTDAGNGDAVPMLGSNA